MTQKCGKKWNENTRNTLNTQPVSHPLLLLPLNAALPLCHRQSLSSAFVSFCRLPSAAVAFCQSRADSVSFVSSVSSALCAYSMSVSLADAANRWALNRYSTIQCFEFDIVEWYNDSKLIQWLEIDRPTLTRNWCNDLKLLQWLEKDTVSWH